MTDEDAFIQALISDPGDKGLRMAFADWLEEHGTSGGLALFGSQPAFSHGRDYLIIYSLRKVIVATAVQVSREAERSDLSSLHGRKDRWAFVWVAGRGTTTLSRSLPLPGLINHAEELYVPKWKSLAAARCKAIDSWHKLKALAVAGVSCFTEGMLDGVSYRHSFWDRETNIHAGWMNPNPKDHRPQTQLISLYGGLIVLADLLPTRLDAMEARAREQRMACRPTLNLRSYPDGEEEERQEAESRTRRKVREYRRRPRNGREW
jgi:uncharacterized protein (TIGR02996 family)